MPTITRRTLLRTAGLLAGGAVLEHVVPSSIARAWALAESWGDDFEEGEHGAFARPRVLKIGVPAAVASRHRQ